MMNSKLICLFFTAILTYSCDIASRKKTDGNPKTANPGSIDTINNPDASPMTNPAVTGPDAFPVTNPAVTGPDAFPVTNPANTNTINDPPGASPATNPSTPVYYYAYLIFNTDDYLASPPPGGRPPECNQPDLSPLQKTLFNCSTGHTSTVTDTQLLEALWIRCRTRIQKFLISLGVEIIYFIQVAPNKEGEPVFTDFFTVNSDDDSADAVYTLHRRIEDSFRRYNLSQPNEEELRKAFLLNRSNKILSPNVQIFFTEPQMDTMKITHFIGNNSQQWVVKGFPNSDSCPF